VLFGTIKDESAEDYYDSYDCKYSPDVKLNHLSFSMPYQAQGSSSKLYLGVGYQTYLDFGIKQKEKRSSSWSGDVEETTDVSGGLNTLTLAGATSIQDKYFIGAAFNKSVLGEIESVQEWEYDESKYKTTTSMEYSGSFFTIGGLARLNPELTVGVMYRSGFEWDGDKEKVKEYEDGELTDSSDNKAEDLTIPSVMGFGVEYELSPGTIVVGELQTRPFSDYEFDGEEFDLDNGYCYRAGIELKNIVPTIRVGVFSDAIMDTDDGDESPISLMGLTGGLGFSLGTIDLDTAFEYGTYSQEDSDGDKYQEHLYRFRVSARVKLE
jgi:hypothetical protein